ncbi:MAG: IS256 family transposase [Tepidiformaceae bacterium]
MAEVELNLTDAQFQALLRGEGGLAAVLQAVLNRVLEAEMTEHLGAAPHERTARRRGHRNGYYERDLTLRVGTIELRVPRDREGSFRSELFERYQRNERALVLALMEMVVNGVSDRKVKRITERLCGHAFSKSTVSALAAGLDSEVEAWNERPLAGTTYPFVWADAMGIKVRREGAVRASSILLITAVNADGYREILGLKVADSESEASWLETFRWLKERGLSGVEIVISDDHRGLVAALRRALQGVIWQRCQVHFMKNVLDATPARHQPAMHRALESILEAESPEAARTAFAEVAAELGGQADHGLEVLEAGLEDAIAVLHVPEKYRPRLRSTNPLERLIEEGRRRERVIRIFPNERSAWRLMGALFAEQHEDWISGRRYFDMTVYFEWKAAKSRDDQQKEAA